MMASLDDETLGLLDDHMDRVMREPGATPRRSQLGPPPDVPEDKMLFFDPAYTAWANEYHAGSEQDEKLRKRVQLGVGAVAFVGGCGIAALAYWLLANSHVVLGGVSAALAALVGLIGLLCLLALKFD